MITLISGQNRFALRPLAEPTLDLSVAVTLSEPTSRIVVGDRRYNPTLLKIPCFVVGDLVTNLDHYIALVWAIKEATQLQADVLGMVFSRNLIAGGEIRPRGSTLAPRFTYDLLLVPSEPWWKDRDGNPVMLWW